MKASHKRADQRALEDLMIALTEDYQAVRILPDDSVAALGDLMFTSAIYLGCTRNGYATRFCFEDDDLAYKRFRELVSEDDVPAGHIARR